MAQTDSSSQLDYSGQRHQEDPQSIAKLQQRTEAQAYELQEQARRIQKLEEKLAEAQLKPASLPQLNEQLLHLKSELLQIVEEQYTRRQQNIRDSNQTL